jgi:hypothetical protein
MKFYSKIIILFFLTLLSSCKVDIGTNEDGQFQVVPITANVTFAQLSNYVLSTSCTRCHAWASDEASVQQRISIGDPDNSLLYQKIKSGQMPPSGSLSSKQILLLENYIKSTKEVQTIPINSTFASIQFHLINKSCLACHNDKGEEISFEGFSNVKRRASDIINILDTGEMEGTPMPPYNADGTRKAPVPNSQVIEAFRTWIQEGKLNN